MDAESLYQTLRNGSPQARRALLESLPDGGMGPAAASMAESDQPGMVILAFVPVVLRLCAGVDPARGTPLALATHRYAVELFETSSDHAGLLPMTLTNLASQYANGRNLLGDADAVLSFTDRWIPYYTRLNERENLPTLKAARINALLNEHRLDEARAALEDPTLRGNWATDIEVARLEKLLRQLTGDITEDKGNAAQRQAAVAASGIVTDEVKNALAQMLNQAIDDPDQKKQLGDSLANLFERAQPTDASTAQGFDSLLETLRQGEAFLTKGQGSDSELTMRRRVREASGIFVGGRRPPPEQIRPALAELEAALAWAREQDHTELIRDSLWGIYLCRGRLGEPSDAADALLELRSDLEEDRAGIADPLKRGGVFSRYPHLFSALCEKLQQADRTAELLEAIEASKGRGVADILTKKAGRPITDASIYSAVDRLPELTREHGFHYITFHVDDERTYVALVSKAGDIHAPAPIPLGRTAIREAAEHADPRDGDTADVLGPLVEWIDAFVDDGVIAPGDHVVYAPDEDLSNVPLHYVMMGGQPLLNVVSLSRIHSAFHLEHVLQRDTRPARYLALIVPLLQNTTAKSWRELQGYLREPVEELKSHGPGDVLEERKATMARFRAATLRDTVVHFSAHGLFPDAGTEGTPFENSGVVLATEAGLPDKRRLLAGDLDGVLTPSDVLDFKLDLAGSHVTIMTCVSGLSREGLGGDALGIEWAFTQAGAVSLLTSHWDVNAKVTAPFVRRFYELWLGESASRAAALKEVMLEFRTKRDLFGKPESWAAFSLTGDWR